MFVRIMTLLGLSVKEFDGLLGLRVEAVVFLVWLKANNVIQLGIIGSCKEGKRRL